MEKQNKEFINLSLKEPCIFIGGPLNQTTGMVACIEPSSPVNIKIVHIDGIEYKYHANYLTETGWEKDEQGYHVLYNKG